MSAVEKARAEYIDQVQVTEKAKRSFTIRARQSSQARAEYLSHPTAARKRTYAKAKATRAHRLRVYRRERDHRNKLRAHYFDLKENGNNPRHVAISWARAQVGTTEATGRNDGPKIRGWQRETARGATYLDGAPYCGIGVENACRRAGVKTSSRWASVAFCEDDAKAKRNGFRGWTTDPSRVQTGDLVILFGRGVHIEIVRTPPKNGIVKTVGFNTSPGNSGSQSNGGGVYYRDRYLSTVHGFPLVDYSN